MKTLYESLLDDEEELLGKDLFDIPFKTLKNRKSFYDFITSLQHMDNNKVKLNELKNGDWIYFINELNKSIQLYELYIGVVGSYMYEVAYSSNGGIILPIRYNIGSGPGMGKVMYAHNGEMFANPIKKDTVFYKLSDSHIDSFKKLLKKHDVDYTDMKLQD